MTATSIIIVPGWRDSGPGHWQSLWAERLPQACRVVQDDWITPTRAAWVGQLEKTVLAAAHPVVIVAHSLGCIATTHMGPEAAARVQGALLVAPGDVEQPDVAGWLPGWAPVARQPLPFPAVLVASRNDPYCRFERAQGLAQAWGARLVSVA